MTSLSDFELLNRTSRGDCEAFGQLVVRHQSLVCAFAYSIVGDFARSEDVAQEAFIAVGVVTGVGFWLVAYRRVRGRSPKGVNG
jgi:hypothetical protein